MKEITYEDWQKNPTPRMMWVWNDDFEEREKQKVVYVIKDDFVACPVLSVSEEDSSFCIYCCCAEIAKRRMTNKELSWWLSEKPHRELKIGDYIYHDYDYKENEQDDEVTDFLFIREDEGEWREPLVEVEE